MLYCVGLTGTIASGKSTAAHYFSSQGIDVFSADIYAKALCEPGEPAFDEIKQYFGNSVVTKTGILNRQAIRKRILANTIDKAWLEACLHPRIRRCIELGIKTVQTAYCVIEIPLLTERKNYPYLNRVLLIEATTDTQIERLMARDHCSHKEALSFLAIQPYQVTHRNVADDILMNQGTTIDFKRQLASLHQKYLLEAQLICVSGIKN
jgi:dephospho-CoA kinase